MQDHSPIATSGILCEGECIVLSWVEPHEYDFITDLRNRPHIRKWFFDDRPIDKMHNRLWLAEKMDRPKESLLSIRWKTSGKFLGTIGWSDWDWDKGTAIFGRVALENSFIRTLASEVPDSYIGFALDAGLTLRDFSFLEMGLQEILTFYVKSNAMARKLNENIGFSCIGNKQMRKAEGEIVTVAMMHLTREEWIRLRTVEERA